MFKLFGRKKPTSPVCLNLTDRDHLTLHQLYEGVLAIGGIGSGKTTTMAHLMEAIMRQGAGMLILTSKSTDMDDVRKIAARAARLKDVIEFAPGKGRFDPITHEINCRGGSIQAAGQFLSDAVDFASKISSSESHEPFWTQAASRVLRMAATVLHHATGRCEAIDLYQFVTSMPTSRSDITGVNENKTLNNWKAESFCARMLAHGASLGMTPDLEIAGEFILGEWPRLSDRTSSSVMMHCTTLTEKLISGSVRDLLSGGESTATPDDILNCKIVAVNTPALVYREPGQLVQMLWKLSTIRTVLRRNLADNDRPVCIWADEAQMHALPSVDSMTQAVARSHRLINVAITQNIPLLVTLLKRREDVMAWISNLQTKLVFANSDKDTNEFFSSLFGSSKHIFGGFSTTNAPFDLMADWLGQSQQSTYSGTEHWHPDVPPHVFATGQMRKGGKENRYWVDFYVHQTGRTFSSGKPWIKTAMKQHL